MIEEQKICRFFGKIILDLYLDGETTIKKEVLEMRGREGYHRLRIVSADPTMCWPLKYDKEVARNQPSSISLTISFLGEKLGK